MNNSTCHSLIIGGTGQFGISLKNLLNKKKKKVIITSRFKKSITKKKNFEVIILDIYNKKKIFKVIEKYKPQNIFYFAGQSSLTKSLKNRKETFKSHYNGTKNFLDVLKEKKLNTKK